MKLKTLLLVVAILCVSLFVVACGDEDTTTAGEGPDGTTAATTTKATTKKTTKETTTKVTTTTVTTTLDPNYKNILPAKLPDNSTYDIHTRIGLESEADFLGVSGNYTDAQWTATGAVYGNAFSMKVDPAKGSRIESYLDLLDPIEPKGVKGIMWYVDFSAAVAVADKPMCTSTTINTNDYRSNMNGNGTAKGYYYKDGVWTETSNVNACRMEIPANFKGWVYVPLNQYTKGGKGTDNGELCDANGLGTDLVFVSNIRLYTDGYDYATSGAIIFDEVIYVK